jgi:transcriptional regulator
MYQPAHFREDRLELQHALIHDNPFGAMVSVGPNGLVANHFPFVLDRAASPLGTLRAHMARANDQWKHLDGERESLVIFQGVDAYITPSWYATKAETQKAVPTWNYAIVHVYGTPRIVDDAEWLRRHVSELTTRHEASLPEPWQVTDAPADFIASMLKAIVGVELVISRIEGKTKASQNRPEIDRAGVVQGLTGQGDERSRAMAELVAASNRGSNR